jgi:hypothetical protein
MMIYKFGKLLPELLNHRLARIDVRIYIWEHHDGEHDDAGVGRLSIVTLT